MLKSTYYLKLYKKKDFSPSNLILSKFWTPKLAPRLSPPTGLSTLSISVLRIFSGHMTILIPITSINKLHR